MNTINAITQKIKAKKNILFAILFYLFFIGSIMAKCFYFQYTTKLNIRPYTHIVNIKMYLASLSVLLVLFAFIFFLFNKKRFIAFIVLDLLLSILIFSDTVYFRYYNNPITIPVLVQIGLIGPLGESIMNLVKRRDILIYFFDIPLMIAGAFFIYKAGVSKIHIVKRLIISVLIVAISITSFKIVYGYTKKGEFPFDKNYVAKLLGIVYFHGADTSSFVKENILTKKTLTQEEKTMLDNFYSAKGKQADNNNFKDFAKGKNILLVQSEALQDFLVNRTINGKEITPNLNKLIKESLYFDNIYYQAFGGKTSDAEFLSNTSLYPLSQGAVYLRYPGNMYHSLPKIMKQQGYSTYSFHAYEPSYWNRAVMYRSLEYDTFHSKSSYKADEKAGWGVSDASFFRQSLDKLNMEKPFLGLMVTLSSHYPFDYFKDFEFDVGEFEGKFLGNYIKGENYADKCLGTLIEELKKRGMYDNTILVLYGDHYGIPKLEAGKELVKFLGIPDNDFEYQKLEKVPFLIHYPGLKNGETVSITGGQIDILPTLANIAGFEAPYAMGKDLLNTDNGYALLRNGSLITDDYIYLSETAKAYDIKSGTVLDKSSYE